MLEITAALGAVRTAVDIARMAVDARDDARAKQAIAEIQMKLLDVMSAALAVSEKAAALQAALVESQDAHRQLKAAVAEKEACTLAEIRPGGYAYSSKLLQEGNYQHTPYFCQPCYDKGVKALLKFSPAREGADALWECPETKQHEVYQPGSAIPVSYRL